MFGSKVNTKNIFDRYDAKWELFPAEGDGNELLKFFLLRKIVKSFLPARIIRWIPVSIKFIVRKMFTFIEKDKHLYGRINVALRMVSSDVKQKKNVSQRWKSNLTNKMIESMVSVSLSK